MAAQDLEEPFDLYDADGTPRGTTKPRALVHRDGDWHRSLHIWVILSDDAGGSVVFQRRSRDKDTWPGALDVAVTGHYRAGESLAEALREADEEIGLPLSEAMVVRLGERWRAEDRGDLHDHEIQDVLATRTRRALESLRPHRDEVEALLAVSLADARSLLAGEPVPARLLLPGGVLASEAEVTKDELVPAPDGYYQLALQSITEWLARGAPPEPWRLGVPAR